MKEILVKTFLGQDFVYETEVNSEGQSLWDTTIDTKFSEWTRNLYLEQPSLFVVQFNLTPETNHTFNLLQDILSKEENELTNSLIVTYLKEVEQKITRFQLTQPLTIQRAALLSPSVMLEITSLSRMLQIPSSEIVSHSLNQMLLLANSSDELMRQFWSTSLLKKI